MFLDCLKPSAQIVILTCIYIVSFIGCASSSLYVGQLTDLKRILAASGYRLLSNLCCGALSPKVHLLLTIAAPPLHTMRCRTKIKKQKNRRNIREEKLTTFWVQHRSKRGSEGCDTGPNKKDETLQTGEAACPTPILCSVPFPGKSSVKITRLELGDPNMKRVEVQSTVLARAEEETFIRQCTRW